MNKKLIALAVASTFVLPAVAQADDMGPAWFGKVRLAVQITDPDEGSTTTDIANATSRFGVKGTEDLGNGLTGHYRLEFSVLADKADIQDEQRQSYVGLSGTFGQVLLGKATNAQYTFTGGMMDSSQSVGGDAYGAGAPASRTSNVLAYRGSAGAVSYGVDLVMDGENTNANNLDAWTAGLGFKTGSLEIGLGASSIDGGDAAEDTDSTSVAVKYHMDNLWIGAGYAVEDDGSADDATGAMVHAGGTFGEGMSWWLALEELEDNDTGLDDSIVNANVVKSLGKNTWVFAELGAGDTKKDLLLGIGKDF